jgi:hypothetical protein
MVPGSKVHRQALVIGNGAYKGPTALKNPSNDATAVGKKLADLGFDVRVEIDTTGDRMIRAIGEFTRQLGEAYENGLTTSAVLFYAGHGIQVDGENFLLPVDSDVRTKLDLQHRTVALGLVLEALSSAAHASVVLLDCCRDNPLPRTLGPASRSLAAAQGLANVRAPKGVYVAFATQPHFVALDGTGANSPFTEGLLQFMGDPGKHVSDVLMDVRRVVYEKTNGQQIPWDHSALFEPFRFFAGDITKIEGMSEESRLRVLQAESEAREESYWQVIQKTDDANLIHSFVTQFPNSKHRAAALARIDRLKSKAEWRRAMLWLGGIAGVLIFAFLGFLWFGKETMADTNLLSGDIENSEGFFGFETSREGCRLRCVLDRFERPCVAFSYDTSATPNNNLRCYPKYEAVFFFKPTRYNAPSADSEIMPHIFRSRPRPVETRFTIQPDRTLIGEPVPADAVNKLLSGKLDPVEDLLENRKYWPIRSGGECQKVCTDLMEACKGFTYTRVLSRCELFRSVKGITRDNFNNRPVTVPGTLSACNDPSAMADPGDQDPTKPNLVINDCLIQRPKTP